MIGLYVGLSAFIPSAAEATALCKINVSECPSQETWGAGTPLEAELAEGTKFSISTSLGTISCTSFALAGELTGAGTSSSPVPGSISTFSLSGCTLGGASCTATTVNLPYAFSVTGSGGSGTANLEDPVGVGATLKCGFLVNCTFSTTKAGLTMTGGNPADLSGKEVPVSRAGGLCPSASSWTLDDRLWTPRPARVVLGPILPANPCINPKPAAASFGNNSVGSTSLIKEELTKSTDCNFNVAVTEEKIVGGEGALGVFGKGCLLVLLAPTCSLEFSFEPPAAQSYSATAKFKYNGGELEIPMSGRGI